MRLDSFLRRNNLTLAQFGAKMDVAHVTVWRWAAGLRMPRRGSLRKISELTGGKVTANDFAASDKRAES